MRTSTRVRSVHRASCIGLLCLLANVLFSACVVDPMTTVGPTQVTATNTPTGTSAEAIRSTTTSVSGNYGAPEDPAAGGHTQCEPVPASAKTATELKDIQLEEVQRLLGTETRLETLLDGTPFEVGGIEPWIVGVRELKGAVASLALNKPVTHQGILPSATVDETGGSSYKDGEALVEAQGLERLYVVIDLDRKKIVSIEVAEADSVSSVRVVPASDASRAPPRPPKVINFKGHPSFERDPELTGSRLWKVECLLDADTRLQSLLDGTPFTVARIGPWL